ncbi:MAG: hypothetical protein C0432_03200 [Candidatus Puniceispirillum sp.]|nr:hypothetical protein [Candidatus Pelagibacter sp.]MBA4283281.1 hypothetical protein [Candidatus Puniceispirillum sp.]
MTKNIVIPQNQPLTQSDLHTLHSYGISEHFDNQPRNRFQIQNSFQIDSKKPTPAFSPQLTEQKTPTFRPQNGVSQKIQPSTTASNPIALLLEEFKKDIKQCSSISELQQTLLAHNKLPLCLTATQPVVGHGDLNSPIVFIGEAPGEEEDLEGKPFVGKAGKLLTAVLDSVNINREKIFITNTVPWRPPGNRIPTSIEINFFKPFIHRLLQIIKPKVIVTLGGTATSGLCTVKSGIVSMRGKIIFCNLDTLEINSEYLDIKEQNTLTKVLEYTNQGNPIIIPTYHPSYLIRSPGQKKHAWSDMITLKKVLDTLQFF